jgi:glucosamine kinase
VGLAGVSTLISDASAARTFERLWRDLGLTCPVRVVSDVTVAFAAGTPEPDGTLALSGTGAVAARMRDRMPARFRDGYGWLLGDDGSGFWIGRQAVRATLAAVDGRAETGELARAVLMHYLGIGQGVGQGAGRDRDPGPGRVVGRDQNHASAPRDAAGNGTPVRPDSAPRDQNHVSAPRDAAGNGTPVRPDSAPRDQNHASAPRDAAGNGTPLRPDAPTPAALFAGEGFTRPDRRQAADLVHAVAARTAVDRAALAALAPLVMAAGQAGDPAARSIVARAAAHLVAALAGVDPAPGEPVVLAGSVLTSRSPVFHEVAAAVADRWPGSAVRVAAEGAAGAAWLAAAGLLGPGQAAVRHAAFTGSAKVSADVS